MFERGAPGKGQGLPLGNPKTPQGDTEEETRSLSDRDERGRPTVQELSPMEVMRALARKEGRGRELRTIQEIRPKAAGGGTPNQGAANDKPPADGLPYPAQALLRGAQVTAPAGSDNALVDIDERRPTLRMEEVPQMLHARVEAEAEAHGVRWQASSGAPAYRPVVSGIRQDLMVVQEEQPLQASQQSPVQPVPQELTVEPDLRLVMLREPDSKRAAAYRVLRYRVEQIHESLQNTVIALCSPRSGQGTSTAAANLALALSECDRAKVCLVEGNLRRPQLAALFRFCPPMCLIERMRLERDEPLSPWCVAEITPSLHVLAVGEKTPSEPLVNGPAFAAALEAMRRAGYRHVIVDGPEVLGIADMNLVEESVDGVLLLARGGVTTRADLRQAATQLASQKLRGLMLLDSE